MKFTRANREQINFLGYSLAEMVPFDAKCRFIVRLIEKLNLKKLLCRYSHKGAGALDPTALLATWFLAYSEGITSTRKLEKLCGRDTYYIYASADLGPDHTTLSRFRNDHRDLLEDYFVEIVHLAHQQGLTDFTSVHTDGTKIQAQASKKKSRDAEQLQKMLARVKSEITAYMQQCEMFDATEIDQKDDVETVREKIARLKAFEQTLVQRQQQLEARKEELTPRCRKKHKINLVEPDARNMENVNGKQSLPAYNAQASFEEKNQFIIAAEVTTDPNDLKQMIRQIENVNKNVGEDKERKSTFDSGYHSKEKLADTLDHDVVVADPKPEHRSIQEKPTPINEIQQEGRRVERADFAFYKEQDYYECPAGEKLVFKKTYKRGKTTGRVYEKKTSCSCCVLMEKCLAKTNKSGIKSISRDDREELAETMYRKLQTEEAKERLKKRMTTAEPGFGVLKQQMGFRRFNLRGHEKVKCEWLLMCLTYNINKLYKLTAATWALNTDPTKNTPEKRRQDFTFYQNLQMIAVQIARIVVLVKIINHFNIKINIY